MGFYTIMKKLGLVADANPRPRLRRVWRKSGGTGGADDDASPANSVVAAGQHEPLRLGAQATCVWLTSGPWAALVDLTTRARQATLTPPITVEGIAKNDEEVDQILSTVKGIGCGHDSQYVRPSIRRKRLRCLLMSVPESHAVNFWVGKNMEDLVALVPDQGEHLPLKSHMSVIELTNFFGFSLVAGPLLVSMTACLWKGAIDEHGYAEVEKTVLDPALSRISASMEAYSTSIGKLPLDLPCHPCPSKAMAKAPAEICAATPNVSPLKPIVTPSKGTKKQRTSA